MLVYEENSLTGFVEPIWLYPAPPPALSSLVPYEIRRELEEARGCLRYRMHTAAAVMAGRALEGIAKLKGVEARGLHRCIEVLAQQGILDGRFVDWAHKLKVLRNQAAHFTGEEVVREDAEDAVALVEAIATYIYVFTSRFDEFMSRRDEGSSPAT
ncbi:DUF4145 domain-containing protein [Nonomuraea pusilla]|uniref:DUF4145 domain-containing protein n=1 Tax=Nonomuraea pusilla TaxID=46177 RepID=UPI0015A607D2|nr:DUF4145 domain-containing protein [Nonomuraea pusilla]